MKDESEKPSTPTDPKLARLQKAVDDAQADYDAKQNAAATWFENARTLSNNPPERQKLVNEGAAAFDVLKAAQKAYSDYLVNNSRDEERDEAWDELWADFDAALASEDEPQANAEK